MCRIFGAVAGEAMSIRHELLEAEHPMIHRDADEDSGWGMAVYRRPEGNEPTTARFPDSAYGGPDFDTAIDIRGRIFNVHVRRATYGALTAENTHPFCLGNYTFAHNGTLASYPRLIERGVTVPAGQTDSEAIFNYLMAHYDPGNPIGSLRHVVSAVIARSAFSELNFLFSDGERLYAYRLGECGLHWLARPGQELVASEPVTDEPWHTVAQDVLLVLDPTRPGDPHAERLLGDALVRRARIDPLVAASAAE
jgi:predicted glutamine amidotransferase